MEAESSEDVTCEVLVVHSYKVRKKKRGAVVTDSAFALAAAYGVQLC